MASTTATVEAVHHLVDQRTEQALFVERKPFEITNQQRASVREAIIRLGSRAAR